MMHSRRVLEVQAGDQSAGAQWHTSAPAGADIYSQDGSFGQDCGIEGAPQFSWKPTPIRGSLQHCCSVGVHGGSHIGALSSFAQHPTQPHTLPCGHLSSFSSRTVQWETTTIRQRHPQLRWQTISRRHCTSRVVSIYGIKNSPGVMWTGTSAILRKMGTTKCHPMTTYKLIATERI